MSGADAGAGAGASAKAEMVARIAAAAAARAMGSSAAEARAAVEDMIDQGYIQDANEGLAYCPKGHSFECWRGACPTCGSDPGEPPSTNQLVSPDEEISRDEERTSSEEDDDARPMLADEPSVLEQLEFALNDSGCPDAQDVAMKLVLLWDKGPPTDIAVVHQLAEEHGWSSDAIRCMELAFERLTRAKAKHLPRQPADSQSFADIRFWRDGKEMRWNILDHLAGFTVAGRSGKVTLGGVRFRDSARAVKQIRERTAHLEALARELTTRRKDFFDANDPAEAMRTLKQPLTQKEICEAIHISPSMLSYWCDYRGRKKRKTKGDSAAQPPMTSMRVGVEVATPHGVLSLAKFFTKPSRVKGGEERSQEEIQEDVEELLGKAEKQGLNGDEIVKAVLEEHGIELAKRTVRKYKKRVAETKKRQLRP